MYCARDVLVFWVYDILVYCNFVVFWVSDILVYCDAVVSSVWYLCLLRCGCLVWVYDIFVSCDILVFWECDILVYCDVLVLFECVISVVLSATVHWGKVWWPTGVLAFLWKLPRITKTLPHNSRRSRKLKVSQKDTGKHSTLLWRNFSAIETSECCTVQSEVSYFCDFTIITLHTAHLKPCCTIAHTLHWLDTLLCSESYIL